MNNRFSDMTLGQQLGLLAAGLCLLVGIALVALAAVSGSHLQQAQQQEFGDSLAQQISRRVGTALETGDLLSISAALQRFVATSSAEQVAVYDLEGKPLGSAGSIQSGSTHEFRAPVYIDNNTAGEIIIAISSEAAARARQRFVLGLLGLALLLSVGVFGLGRQLGQYWGKQLNGLSSAIRLDGAEPDNTSPNELTRLTTRVQQLPMDLLRARRVGDPQDENYRSTAVLFVQCHSLAEYVDTLDQASLQRYTRRLHQVMYGAAGFYGGELQVTRQFGLCLYFSGDSQAGSAAFRAVCCAWLMRELCQELERQQSLSMRVFMAISLSDVAAGNADDIYPGLYIQHIVDELQQLCANQPPQPLITDVACADEDVAGRVDTAETDLPNCQRLVDFADPYRDLLERQLRLIWKQLAY